MPLNHSELGEAVRNRRKELGLSQRDAADRSKWIDARFYGGDKGISEKAWQVIEQAAEQEPRRHTLLMIDGVLGWPEGTAHAILWGQEPPDGPPVTERGTADRVRDGSDPVLRAAIEGLVLRVEALEQREQVLLDELDALHREVVAALKSGNRSR